MSTKWATSQLIYEVGNIPSSARLQATMTLNRTARLLDELSSENKFCIPISYFQLPSSPAEVIAWFDSLAELRSSLRRYLQLESLKRHASVTWLMDRSSTTNLSYTTCKIKGRSSSSTCTYWSSFFVVRPGMLLVGLCRMQDERQGKHSFQTLGTSLL